MLNAFKKLFGAGEDTAATQPSSASVFQAPLVVAMQPLFTAEKSIWGYELLFRTPASLTGGEAPCSANEDFSNMVAEGYSIIKPELSRNQRVLLRFGTEQIVQGLPLLLPIAQIGVEIDHSGPVYYELTESLKLLQSAKGLLIIDNYTGSTEQKALLPFVKMVKIPTDQVSASELPAMIEELKSLGIQSVATHVENHTVFDQCLKLGFDLFQGGFISLPLVMRGNVMNTSQLSSLRILKKIADEHCSAKDITELLRMDNTITYRLLRFVNSMHHGFSTKISSIEQAVSLVGLNPLKQWLPIAVLSKVSTAPEVQYLVWLSALRGKFLENIALLAQKNHMNPPGMPAAPQLFLLGLFSLLGTIYGISSKDLAEQLSLDDEFIKALYCQEGSLAPWLQLAVYTENASWEPLEKTLKDLGLNAQLIAEAYLQALEWSRTFYEGSKGSL